MDDHNTTLVAEAVGAMFQGMAFAETHAEKELPGHWRHVIRAAAVAISDAARAADPKKRSTVAERAVTEVFKMADDGTSQYRFSHSRREALEHRLRAAVDALVGIPSGS